MVNTEIFGSYPNCARQSLAQKIALLPKGPRPATADLLGEPEAAAETVALIVVVRNALVREEHPADAELGVRREAQDRDGWNTPVTPT
jgi:hypothetical protein